MARFGGDEFVVLLNGVGEGGAAEVGQRIVDSVAAPLEGIEHLDRVTVSVGLAPVVRRDDAVETADRAMLEAKRSGRGRLVTARGR